MTGTSLTDQLHRNGAGSIDRNREPQPCTGTRADQGVDPHHLTGGIEKRAA